MSPEEAQEVLVGVPLVQVTVASMTDVQRLRLQCLAADIPAMITRPEEGCGSS